MNGCLTQQELKLGYKDDGPDPRHLGANGYTIAQAIDRMNSREEVPTNDIDVDVAAIRAFRQTVPQLSKDISPTEKGKITIAGKNDLYYALAQHRLDKNKYPNILSDLARMITVFRKELDDNILRDIVATVGTSNNALMVVHGGPKSKEESNLISAYSAIGNVSNALRHFVRPFHQDNEGNLLVPKIQGDHVKGLMQWDKRKMNAMRDKDYQKEVLNLLENAFYNKLNDPENLLPLFQSINASKGSKIRFDSQIQEYINRVGKKGKEITFYMFGSIWPQKKYEGVDMDLEYDLFMHQLAKDPEYTDMIFTYHYVPQVHREQINQEVSNWKAEKKNDRMKLEKELRAREKAWDESQITMDFRS